MTASRPRIQSLIFEVTQRCNHACLHCYNVWHGADGAPSDYPRGELDTERTLALLGKALDETACSHVTPTGGEPLLRGDLNAILDYLRGRNLPVTIISNGRLLGEAAAGDCLDRGVGLFGLPLLCPQRGGHDPLSGAAGGGPTCVCACRPPIRCAGRSRPRIPRRPNTDCRFPVRSRSSPAWWIRAPSRTSASPTVRPAAPAPTSRWIRSATCARATTRRRSSGTCSRHPSTT